MIFVDGAYRSDGSAPPVFHPVPPPDAAHLQALVRRIAERVGRMLDPFLQRPSALLGLRPENPAMAYALAA